MNDLNEKLTSLRAVLHETPSQEGWARLCAFFDAPMPNAQLEMCLDYALPVLERSWPDELRVPPPHWHRRGSRQEHVHPAWALVKAYDVHLMACGGNRIKVIKVLRERTGLGLKECKQMSESVPCLVLRACGQSDAEQAQEGLEAAGGVVCVVPCNEPVRTEVLSRSKASFAVVLIEAGPSRTHTIRAMREGSGQVLGVRWCVDVIASVPITVMSGLSQERARFLEQSLLACGAKARVFEVDGFYT